MFKCGGKGCPIANRCLRFRSVPCDADEFLDREPYNHYRGICQQFFPVDPDRDVRDWVSELLEYTEAN